LSAYDFVERDNSISDISNRLVVSNEVSSSFFQIFMELAISKDANLDLLTGALGKHACASNHLVTFSWVDIQFDYGIDRLSKFALLRNFFNFLNCLLLRKFLCGVQEGVCRLILSRFLVHSLRLIKHSDGYKMIEKYGDVFYQ
jgi:hypothetical protein